MELIINHTPKRKPPYNHLKCSLHTAFRLLNIVMNEEGNTPIPTGKSSCTQRPPDLVLSSFSSGCSSVPSSYPLLSW